MGVHLRRVGPVRLHGDEAETVALDQAPGDGGACPVKLGGAMRRLAQQHHARTGEAVECRPERAGLVRVR